MKIYNTPFVEIVEFNVADIITISAPDMNAEYDDTANAPDSWFN